MILFSLKRISTDRPKSRWGPVGIGYVRPDQFLDHLTVIINRIETNVGPHGNRHKRQVESCRPDFKGDSGQFKFSIPNVVLVTSRFLIFF